MTTIKDLCYTVAKNGFKTYANTNNIPFKIVVPKPDANK